MNFKLRPFQRIIECPGMRPAITAKGEITDGTYISSLDAASFHLPTVEVGNDTRGAYAIVSEAEIPIENGLLLKVSSEFQPGCSVPGCELQLARPGNSQRIQEQLRLNGIDPLKVNFLIPQEGFVSVSFSSQGTVIGTSCLGRTAMASGKGRPKNVTG